MATAVGGISFSLSAVDNVSATVDKISKRITSMVVPSQKTSQSIARLTDVSGVLKLSQGMEGLAGRSLETFRSMDRIVPVLGAITGAASIAGMGMLLQRWGEFGIQSPSSLAFLPISCAIQVLLTPIHFAIFSSSGVITGDNSEAMERAKLFGRDGNFC